MAFVTMKVERISMTDQDLFGFGEMEFHFIMVIL